MKRMEALAPLSREHHETLILAQLLKLGAPDYKGLPTTTEGKAEYAFERYQQKIQSHFENEETMLKKVLLQHEELRLIIDDILQEHAKLSQLFTSLPGTEVSEARLDVLGHLLQKHIRKEERVLFPKLQEVCSPALLSEIHDLLH